MSATRCWRVAWHSFGVVAGCGRRAMSVATRAPIPPLLLRDYQEECIQSVLASFARGQKRVGISLATGAGKTVIFTQLIDRIEAPTPGADCTLILAHRRELVEQAARHCTQAYPDKSIEIEMGSMHASGTADITIASVRSLTSGRRLEKFNPRLFKLLLVDEAHHIVASGYMQTLKHFGLDQKPAAADGEDGREHIQQRGTWPHTPALVGVSATFSRFDGLAIGAAIDEIVYHKDYVDMIGDGWLSDIVFTTVQSKADLSHVRSGTGKDFQIGDLSRAVNTPEANEVTVRTWLAKAASAGRKSTLVFCVDLSHVADLTQAFRDHGIDAKFVTGDTDRVERGRRLDSFKRGDFPVLLNCGVFTEGTDMPNVDCIVLARPTKSRNLLIQMIGRGMRLHAGKTNCHIIDMVSSLETGIVTTPTLFGLHPNELVTEASVENLQDLRKQRLEDEKLRQELLQPSLSSSPSSSSSSSAASLASASIHSVSFTDYNSVFDIIADTSGEKFIRVLSRYSWVQVGRARFVLCGPTGTYLRLEELNDDEEKVSKDDNTWQSHENRESSDRSKSSKSGKVKKGGQSKDGRHDRNDKSKDDCRYRVVELRALPPGLTKSPFARPREICRSPAFTDAVHAADTYAATAFPRPFILTNQSWRRGPPTHGQLGFLNKLRSKGEEMLTEQDITRGMASDMITKVKHGARGRFSDFEAERRRRGRELASQDRENALREREQVSVGPLDR